MQHTPRCRSCGAPVCWARVEASGKLVPLQAEPGGAPIGHPDTGGAGRIQGIDRHTVPGDLFGNLPDGLLVEVLGNGQAAATDRPIWLSHFVDCPDADNWRADQ